MDLWKAGVGGVVLLVALLIILRRKEDPETRKFAERLVLFILGHWFW